MIFTTHWEVGKVLVPHSLPCVIDLDALTFLLFQIFEDKTLADEGAGFENFC